VAVEWGFGMWLGMAVSFVAMVPVAILAGRGKSSWRVFPLLFFEWLMFGAALIFWMFLVWFSAKAIMSFGVSASLALVAALALGIALAALTVVGGLRLMRVGYTMVGHKDQYGVDFGNSLWFGRTGTWRPKEFRQP
jgi:hypothetical protein